MKKVGIKQNFKKIIANEKVKKVAFIALCVIVALCVFRLLLLLFPVKEFEIEGETRYDINELIDASGIRNGDRLYWLDKSEAAERLLAKCPYLKSVKIKQKFPNKICFAVEERVAGWYVQVGEDFYALDYDLKVLLETGREETLTERGLTRLILPELESVVAGEYPKFGQDDEHLMSETLRIIDTIRTHEIKDRLTSLDLSNRFEIKMVIDQTYTVNFGDMSDSQTKFDMIEQIISTAAVKGYAGGEINVINPSSHSFKGYYADESEGQ